MHRTLFSTACSVLLASVLAVTVGCGNDDNNQGNGAISVQTVQPADAGTCVDVSSPVRITFNTAADAATVNSDNIQVDDGNMNPVAGTVAFDASTNTATFTPSSALASNVTYTVTVSNVSSSSGVVMSNPFTSTFKTGPCSGAQAQYKVSLFPGTSGTDNHGQVSVDTGGVVTTELTGGAASTTYTLNFCPAPTQDYTCFKVGDVTTDASGNANTTANFPQSGSWAGDFHLDTGSSTSFMTVLMPGASSPVYTAALQPATTANGSGIFSGNPPGPQDPLASGTVTVTNGAAQVELKGASATSTYSTSQCPTAFGSSCFQLTNSSGTSAFTTDSNGDLTYTVLLDASAGDIFRVHAPTGRSGFVAGFKVP